MPRTHAVAERVVSNRFACLSASWTASWRTSAAISITSGQWRSRPVFATKTAIDRSSGSCFSLIAARIRTVHASSSGPSSAFEEFRGMLKRSVRQNRTVACNVVLVPIARALHGFLDSTAARASPRSQSSRAAVGLMGRAKIKCRIFVLGAAK